jgi:hypothetical protein
LARKLYETFSKHIIVVVKTDILAQYAWRSKPGLQNMQREKDKGRATYTGEMAKLTDFIVRRKAADMYPV